MTFNNKQYDVVVVGGGNAGMCAAISAAEAGASVLVLEHAPKEMRGGNSRHTRNMRAMHRAPTNALSDAYLEDEYWDDLLRVTGGETSEQLARITIRGTEQAMPWMESHGVYYQPSLKGTLNLSRTNAFFFGGGKTLVNALYRAARELRVDVEYDAEVTDFIFEDGRITDVRANIKGTETSFNANATIVASGGFQANIDWLAEHWGEAAKNFRIRGTPYAQGRVLKQLLANDIAPVGDPTQCHAVAIDARAPRFDGGIVTRLDCVPFGIVVNRNAERFYDEGEDVWPKRYAIWGRLVAQQPDQVAYAIIDSKSEMLFMPSVFPAIKTDSIASLASALDLDPTKLEETVSEFNVAAGHGRFDNQVLDSCHTVGVTPHKTNWARPIDTPPFIAYPLCPGITFTYLGVKVDEHAQVIMNDGRIVSNLYAAGEIMAGNILGQGYLAGFGMAIGTVFGRIAGTEAAQHAGV
jgi:tricarballylate dehydrogenase